MPYLVFLLIVIFIVGYVFLRLCLGILEVGSAIISAIKNTCKRKTRPASKSHGNFVNESIPPSIDKRLSSTQYGLHGRCEICGQNFTPVASASENHLNEVAIDFYGKRRVRKLCTKCSQLMLEDKNCIARK